MRYRLRDLLPGKPKTPGFGISRDFYLSVLAARMPLPSLLQIVNPKGAEGAVAGFGVPVTPERDKDSLARPLERGVYGLADPDRRTVLKLRVLSKEEAGYDPEAMLRTRIAATLNEEARRRAQATWSILQFTFEAHDPRVYPALDFLLGLVKRAADLADGLVADPLAQLYRLPDEVLSPRTPGQPVAVQDLVDVKVLPSTGGLTLHTAGLVKFARPEVEIDGVGPAVQTAAERLLFSLANEVLLGATLTPGDRVGKLFRVAEGGLDRARWEGVPVVELIPEAPGGTDAALSALE